MKVTFRKKNVKAIKHEHFIRSSFDFLLNQREKESNELFLDEGEEKKQKSIVSSNDLNIRSNVKLIKVSFDRTYSMKVEKGKNFFCSS